MVERAGTDKFEEPGIEDDSDLFDPEQKARKAAGKPQLPQPSDNYEKHKNYVGDLAAYYTTQLDLSTWEEAEAAIALFKSMYVDGFNAREFIL